MCDNEKDDNSIRIQRAYADGYTDAYLDAARQSAMAAPKRVNDSRSGLFVVLLYMLLLACVYLAFYCAGYADGKKQANRG